MSGVDNSATVAAVQASPVPFDLEATLDKVTRLTAEAAGKGAKLILFPEAYVGGYPWGLAFGTSVGGRTSAGRRTWDRYLRGAVEVPGTGRGAHWRGREGQPGLPRRGRGGA